MPRKRETFRHEDRRSILRYLREFIDIGLPKRVIINRPDPNELDGEREQRERFGIVAVPKGTWKFQTAEGKKEVGEGEIMISPPDAWHEEIGGTERTKLYFGIEPSSVYVHKTWHRDNEVKAHQIDWTYSPVSFGQVGYHLLMALAALDGEHRFQTTAKHVIFSVLVQLTKHLELAENGVGRNTKSYVSYRSILSFIYQHFSQPITREDVAQQLGLHPNHISRLFREHNPNLTFKEHITQLRMSRAARLIRRRVFSIDEICYACGYTDPAHFRKAFKKYHGVTPGQLG